MGIKILGLFLIGIIAAFRLEGTKAQNLANVQLDNNTKIGVNLGGGGLNNLNLTSIPIALDQNRTSTRPLINWNGTRNQREFDNDLDTSGTRHPSNSTTWNWESSRNRRGGSSRDPGGSDQWSWNGSNWTITNGSSRNSSWPTSNTATYRPGASSGTTRSFGFSTSPKTTSKTTNSRYIWSSTTRSGAATSTSNPNLSGITTRFQLGSGGIGGSQSTTTSAPRSSWSSATSGYTWGSGGSRTTRGSNWGSTTKTGLGGTTTSGLRSTSSFSTIGIDLGIGGGGTVRSNTSEGQWSIGTTRGIQWGTRSTTTGRSQWTTRGPRLNDLLSSTSKTSTARNSWSLLPGYTSATVALNSSGINYTTAKYNWGVGGGSTSSSAGSTSRYQWSAGTAPTGNIWSTRFTTTGGNQWGPRSTTTKRSNLNGSSLSTWIAASTTPRSGLFSSTSKFNWGITSGGSSQSSTSSWFRTTQRNFWGLPSTTQRSVWGSITTRSQSESPLLTSNSSMYNWTSGVTKQYTGSSTPRPNFLSSTSSSNWWGTGTRPPSGSVTGSPSRYQWTTRPTSSINLGTRSTTTGRSQWGQWTTTRRPIYTAIPPSSSSTSRYSWTNFNPSATTQKYTWPSTTSRYQWGSGGGTTARNQWASTAQNHWTSSGATTSRSQWSTPSYNLGSKPTTTGRNQWGQWTTTRRPIYTTRPSSSSSTSRNNWTNFNPSGTSSTSRYQWGSGGGTTARNQWASTAQNYWTSSGATTSRTQWSSIPIPPTRNPWGSGFTTTRRNSLGTSSTFRNTWSSIRPNPRFTTSRGNTRYPLSTTEPTMYIQPVTTNKHDVDHKQKIEVEEVDYYDDGKVSETRYEFTEVDFNNPRSNKSEYYFEDEQYTNTQYGPGQTPRPTRAPVQNQNNQGDNRSPVGSDQYYYNDRDNRYGYTQGYQNADQVEYEYSPTVTRGLHQQIVFDEYRQNNGQQRPNPYNRNEVWFEERDYYNNGPGQQIIYTREGYRPELGTYQSGYYDTPMYSGNIRPVFNGHHSTSEQYYNINRPNLGGSYNQTTNYQNYGYGADGTNQQVVVIRVETDSSSSSGTSNNGGSAALVATSDGSAAGQQWGTSNSGSGKTQESYSWTTWLNSGSTGGGGGGGKGGGGKQTNGNGGGGKTGTVRNQNQGGKGGGGQQQTRNQWQIKNQNGGGKQQSAQQRNQQQRQRQQRQQRRMMMRRKQMMNRRRLSGSGTQRRMATRRFKLRNAARMRGLRLSGRRSAVKARRAMNKRQMMIRRGSGVTSWRLVPTWGAGGGSAKRVQGQGGKVVRKANNKLRLRQTRKPLQFRTGNRATSNLRLRRLSSVGIRNLKLNKAGARKQGKVGKALAPKQQQQRQQNQIKRQNSAQVKNQQMARG